MADHSSADGDSSSFNVTHIACGSSHSVAVLGALLEALAGLALHAHSRAQAEHQAVSQSPSPFAVRRCSCCPVPFFSLPHPP